jgi:hypothetical protein
MATVKVAYDVPADALRRIEAVIEHTLAHDPNWNGADIRIEHAETTSVESSDEFAAAQLYGLVRRAIEGDAGPNV